MRVAIVADTHCGSRSGLTPPGWGHEIGSGDADEEQWAEWRIKLWTEYEGICDLLQPVDRVLALGDLCDGKATYSGGVELLKADRTKQAKMAAQCIERMHCANIAGVSGTPRHGAEQGEDWDALALAEVGGRWLGLSRYVDLAGLIMHVKHHVSSSIIPHGKWTGPARENLALLEAALYDEAPRADVIARAHAHYTVWGGTDAFAFFVAPCLEGPTNIRAKTGLRRCSLGVLWFDIQSREDWTWKIEKIRVPSVEESVVTL